VLASLSLGFLIFGALSLLRAWLLGLARRYPAWAALIPRMQGPLRFLAVSLAVSIAMGGLPAIHLHSGVQTVYVAWLQAQGLAFLVEVGFCFVGLRGSLGHRSWAELARVLLYLVLGYELIRLAASLDGETLVLGSTLVSFGLGAALKPALQNLASGVLLRLSRPYDVGHLVQIGDSLGYVESLDWRSTGIELFSGSRLVLPNASAGREIITNFSLPTVRHRHTVEVRFDPSQPPGRIRNALIAAAFDVEPSVEGPVEVFLTSFESGWCVYQLSFWLPSVLWQQLVEVNLSTHLTYALRRSNWTPTGSHRVFHNKK
jgi:small-conductance mechanosensitive channel